MKNFARIDGIGKGKLKKCLLCCLVFAMCLFVALEQTQTAEASAQKKSSAALNARKASTKNASSAKSSAKPAASTASGKKATARKASAKKAPAKRAPAKKASVKKSAPKRKAVSRAMRKPARKAPRKSSARGLAEQPTSESRLSLYQRGIYSTFGWRSLGRRGSRMHKGVDISAKSGADIVAFESGEVIQSGRDGLYGICVLIKQDDGITARYAHMSATNLKEGDRVALGEAVGKVGRTGRATGTHLHFELIREDGKLLNPALHLKDGRQLVADAHIAPGALAYVPQKAAKQPVTVATVEAARKFTESSRLGLMGDFPKQVHILP